jgi:7-cyano-7-deazaguanine synthase
MDSLVCAAFANRYNEECAFLHINYGQRTEARELWAFEQICQHYKPEKKLIVNLPWLGQIGGSALTDTNIMVKDYDGSKDVPLTYVPFRNANLISVAVSWAEVISANRIYIGAVEEDSSGYPDCRKIFYKAMQKTIETGTQGLTPISIETPIISLNKYQIVKLGVELNAPFEYSWSCYKESEIACGVCDSCVLRKRAFDRAGVTDPIPYAK